MKKNFFYIFIVLFVNSYVFASGRLEERTQLRKCLSSNDNIYSFYLEHHEGFSDNRWYLEIYLLNGGYLEIDSFTASSFLNGYIWPDRVGNYSVFGSAVLKETGEITSNAFSILLNKKIETIDDYINNYDEILELVKKIALQTPEERSIRAAMKYTDSDFLEYIGNFESDDEYGTIYAKKPNEPTWSDNPLLAK